MNSTKSFNTVSIPFYNEDPSEILRGYLEVIEMILMWRTIVSQPQEDLSVVIMRQLDAENNLKMTVCLKNREHLALLCYFLKIAGVEISETHVFTVAEDVINMNGTEALEDWKSTANPNEILYLSDFIVRPFIEISGIWPCYEVK